MRFLAGYNFHVGSCFVWLHSCFVVEIKPFERNFIRMHRSNGRAFTSRFLKSRYLTSSDDESTETEEDKRRRQNEGDNDRLKTQNGENKPEKEFSIFETNQIKFLKELEKCFNTHKKRKISTGHGTIHAIRNICFGLVIE